MNVCPGKYSTCALALFVFAWDLVGSLDGSMKSAFGQIFASQTMIRQLGTPEVDSQFAKIDLALEAAYVAAEAELFDVSFEIVERVCAEGTPVSRPQIQSSLLGGQSQVQSRIVAASPSFQTAEVASPFGTKLFGIIDKWTEKKASPESMEKALLHIVFPSDRPNGILLYSNALPQNSTSTNYDFRFSTAKPPRYLAFELIELAAKNKTLPRLVEKIEGMQKHPSSQAQAASMLVYAERISGHPDAAVKILGDQLDNPVAAENVMPLYHGMTRTIPDVDEKTATPLASSFPLLNKLLKQHISRMDIRNALMQQLGWIIEIGDQTAFDAYVAMIVDSIQQSPGIRPESVNYMLENFYRNLTEECKRKGKPQLAISVSSHGFDVLFELLRGSALDIETLARFGDVQPEVWLKSLRKAFIERPLLRMEQFSFKQIPQSAHAPDFFHIPSPNAKFKKLLPYEDASTISLLDLFLNQTEIDADNSGLIKELLANVAENDDIKRFLAVWINFRNEKRGKPQDTEITKLAIFENDKEYLDWWALLPSQAAWELIIHRIRKEPQNADLQAAYETRFWKSTVPELSSISTELQYWRRLASDKSLVKADRLKHWIVSFEPINSRNETQVPLWTIDANQQVESFGGASSCHLIFRYPLPVNSTIKVTSACTEKMSDGVFIGGVSMLSMDTQQRAMYFMATNSRVLGQTTEKITAPSRTIESTIGEKGLSFKFDDKTIQVLEHDPKTVPFVGLASYGTKPAVYSNVAITSPVSIPREVSLLDEGLTGWTTCVFRHALPKLASRIELKDSQSANSSNQEERKPIWKMVEKELRAGKTEAELADQNTNDSKGSTEDPKKGNSHSNISYIRPLCDGESFEYEFFYQPEKQIASPTIGHIAYIFQDENIALKWMASSDEVPSNDGSTNNQIPDKTANDPAAENLAPIKLEANAWNRMQVRLEGGKVVLAIDGKDVYRRPLEKESVARFGLYCEYNKEQIRVRNAVLKGNWPAEIPKDLWELK